MESEESQQNTDWQYETQLFGCTPISILNGMYNAVCDVYRDGLKDFAKDITSKYPGVLTKKELSVARHEVGKKIDDDVTAAFDEFEAEVLDRVFTIPTNVTLPSDSCQLTYDPNSSNPSMLSAKKDKIIERIKSLKEANARLERHISLCKKEKQSLDDQSHKLASMDISGMTASEIIEHMKSHRDFIKVEAERT